MVTLTAYMSAGSKLCSHHGIHGDHHLSLLRHEGIPILNLLLHPVLELIAKDGRTNIYDPLLWHLLDIRVIRQVLVDPRLVAHKLQHLLDREALVLWHMDHLHVIVVKICFLSRQNAFQKVNGRVICRKEEVRGE